MSNLIHIDSINNVDVVDSRLIAIELGIKHQTFLETIRKYQTQLQAFGTVTFETEGLNGTKNYSVFVYLNEEQATFVMTLSRNTQKVVNCKMKLVKSFSQAKQVIKQQKILPEKSAIDYVNAANDIENINNATLQELLRDELIDELSVKRGQKALPITKKEYTIAKVRAKELGYSTKQIGNGSALGRFIAKQIESSFSERVGKYEVKHYEINDQLDTAIHNYFGMKQLIGE